MHRRIVHFSGHVQGVGFRYTTQNLAIQYDVGGFVRNFPDGRVQLVIEGPDPDMDQLINGIRSKLNGHIKRLDVDEAPATGEFQQFYIRH